MTGAAPVRAAGFTDPGGRPYQEDRWAAAELASGAVAAVADGMSDPTGRGDRGASSLVAERACGVFVETASRLIDIDGLAPHLALPRALAAAIGASAEAAALHAGGAAFVGAWLARDGHALTLKVGDCRAYARANDRWDVLSDRDDADRTGALTHWLGQDAARLGAPALIARDGVDALVLGSDGLYRAGAAPAAPAWSPPAPLAVPFFFARDLVGAARRAGEDDNITAVALVRAPAAVATPLAAALSRARPLTLALAAATTFAAGALAASLFLGGAP